MAAARRGAGAPLAAYVLHSWDWSESSLIVELFTRERGRIVVVAKGAKRPYSQLRPVLIPFQKLQVQLGRAPVAETSEVQLLRSAERAEGPAMPAGAGLFAGFYLNELLMLGLARDDAHAALFDAYVGAVTALLAGSEAAHSGILRSFELALLRHTGLLPDLRVETLRQTAVIDAGRYMLQAQGGLVAATGETAIEGRYWTPIEAALRDPDPAALHAAVAPCSAALRLPLRQLLHYHLGVQSLRTRQVMADLRQLNIRRG